MAARQCEATTPDGVQCELEESHVRPRRQIMHDFSGRAGKCHDCGTTRRDSPHLDCIPLLPTPHRVTIFWK